LIVAEWSDPQTTTPTQHTHLKAPGHRAVPPRWRCRRAAPGARWPPQCPCACRRRGRASDASSFALASMSLAHPTRLAVHRPPAPITALWVVERAGSEASAPRRPCAPLLRSISVRGVPPGASPSPRDSPVLLPGAAEPAPQCGTVPGKLGLLWTFLVQ